MIEKKTFIEMMLRTQEPLKKMVDMTPADKIDWRPADNCMSVGQLLKHMTENWGFIRMMVKNDFPKMTPEQMMEMMKLENLPSCDKEEALAGMAKDLEEAAAFISNEISDEDFFNKTVAAPWGFKGEIWKALMMIRDHQMNHKMQLHLYLKLLGLPVNTSTLYGM